MPDDRFDLEKLRRNWGRAASTGPAPAPAWLASTEPPLDPFAVARGELAALRAQIAIELAGEAAALAPFVASIDDAVAALEASSLAGSSDEPALRAKIDKALFNLEDLLEVFLLTRR